ncbi:3-mercaptopyruvate sulfurtransferase [Corynebacterium atrinae]|uniref:sulfurtransferase n=1 Tax=Corynebacterium atrinae TaxID=1336740 RepID=UPI0025B420CC|nr:rhodanese-like domain-containing protein [Corynebacterium atrinae]WJY63312.1 3-mercaptopyruvate sulfurtransferase [Corynebacterium atrinae]
MSPLISIDELRASQAGLTLLCASMGPTPPTHGIPDSYLADLEADFSDPSGQLPHTAPANLRGLFEAYGISDDTAVVVYDQQAGAVAPRIWWLARVAGLSNVRVLNGPWTFETAPFARPTQRGTISAPSRPELLIDAAAVAAGGRLIVDARSAGRFAGTEAEPRPGLRPGHIPGSVNLPYTEVFASDGTYRPAGQLRALFEAVVDKREDLAFTCGSGVTACVDALAATLAGYEDLAVYEGSWSEWGRPDSGRDVAIA